MQHATCDMQHATCSAAVIEAALHVLSARFEPRLAIRVVDQVGATLTEAQVRLIELTPVDVHEAKHGAKLVPPDALTDETLAVGSSPRRGSTITKRSIRAVTGHPLEMGKGDWRSQRVKLATDCCW